MRQLITQRARMLHDIRAFFYQRDVLEVETPALSQAGNTDPSIESFQVDALGDQRYLHTSPEYPMKRMLVASSGDIYQICKVWRAGELGGRHNPEFTMLEWYRLDFTYHQLMQEVETLLLSLLPTVQTASRFISYQQLFLEVLNINPHIASYSALQCCIDSQHIDVVGELDRDAILDLLMTHCIEPTFTKDSLTFVYDYPAQQKALAALSDDELSVAQRFEVYLGSVELGNGYQEQTKAAANAEVLHSDLEKRIEKGMVEVPVDERFLTAIKQGLPMCAGVAMGLDRLLMCQLKKKNLQEVISFPWTVA